MSAHATRILVVDDDSIVADSIATLLRDHGYDAETASGGHAAIEALEASENDPRGPFAVLITDLAMPGMTGVELIRAMRERRSSPAALAITGYPTVEGAIDAVRAGAIDFLIKPAVESELLAAIERAIQQHALLAETQRFRRARDGRGALEAVVGTDPRMLRILELVSAVAPARTTVLMNGESGTGKSLVARAIHRHSPRADRPFVELSCGSIPETLLESELFGHVKGAFTGAHADKKGRFLAAHGGTLFLDEINSASPAMQLKLLRVLQEKRFEPVGSSETVEVDVRVILASNQSLETLVADGSFRQDLYYRINVVSIDLPPLRDRAGDIPTLAEHFLRERCAEHGRAIAGFTADAMRLIRAYRFPGNVRELENLVERAVVLARGGLIGAEDLPPHVREPSAARGDGGQLPTSVASGNSLDPSGGESGLIDDAPWVPMTLDAALREPERRVLLRALRANQWNRQRTADQLGINRTTLYKKMKSLGLDDSERGLAG